MPQITYLPDEVVINAPVQPILQTSLQNEIPHIHVCGGNARCSTCRIMVLEGLDHCPPRNEKETVLATRLHFSPEIRLACQTAPTGNVMVRRLVLDTEDIAVTAQPMNGEKPGMVGQEKKLAILFSDIRGFTTFSETRLPYDVIHLLNRYFHRMDRIITHFGGYIDNYMGDGIMALFGVDDRPDAPYRAVQAGLGMLEEVEKLQPYVEALYKWNLEIGIGIHYGEAVVGNIGATHRQRETAIGDAVNFASRIESENKTLGTHLLVSESVYNDVQDRAVVGRTCAATVKGKQGEHMLFEITALRN